MVGLDITLEAEAGAKANLEANPELAHLIKICIRTPDPTGNRKGTAIACKLKIQPARSSQIVVSCANSHGLQYLTLQTNSKPMNHLSSILLFLRLWRKTFISSLIW